MHMNKRKTNNLLGDELKLRHRNASNRGPWEGSGVVLRFDQSEEVCLELNQKVSGDDVCAWVCVCVGGGAEVAPVGNVLGTELKG